LLAISGGGDAGAFAAGLLAGWTAYGTRSQFKVFTGVSAGALIAPFAFLGPQYDDVLRSVFASIGPKDIFHPRNVLIGLTSDGMAHSGPLSQLVAQHIGSDFSHPHNERFDSEYMKRLFEYAYRLSAKGYRWHKVPPSDASRERE
jgi:predicted acylesterase/phospholipase RssA